MYKVKTYNKLTKAETIYGDAKNYSTKYKTWEIDPLAWLIKLVEVKK
jgi:hypothetical protein